MSDRYALHGFHPRYTGADGIPYLIPLKYGTLRECRAERVYRAGLGWTTGIYTVGTDLSLTALGIRLSLHIAERSPN